jgi:protein-disulfide isomerase
MSPAVAAPQKRAVDWARTVVATPGGGFRMGNPNAKVRLIEYGSLTCPHCRRFAETGMAPLRAYVKGGKVSFEYRNYILNGIDVAAALVARCGGPTRFFPIADRLYATQGQWIARVQALPAAETERLNALAEGDRLVAIAKVAGIQDLAAPTGLTPVQANKCLADPAGLALLTRIVESANGLGVQGTPTFFVNGTKVDAGDWPSLEPLLKKAGG